MAIFPKIQSPCPHKSNLAAVMDGDMCRMCKRQVFDLTDMRDEERVAFMQACVGEVCVSYRLQLRPALAAAALAAASVAMPMAAAAQDDIDIVVGGVRDLHNVKYVEVAADKAVPELPAVYEDVPAVRPIRAVAPPSSGVSDAQETPRRRSGG
ncbi:MAG: hypothetical protein V4610_07135 [Pseudomonadota bacterium]|jgi:predicted Fe-S protein YdhL (DUF1289 family)|uniref:Uncharacterized protein n=1 Tax=hydrothermal vent metagenome TaxID=652676 RepID=A0A160TM77_9ZZZZ